MRCQHCGFETLDLDPDTIVYHKHCWEHWLDQTVKAARGERWYKLEGSESTEVYEEDKDGREHEDHSWLK